MKFHIQELSEMFKPIRSDHMHFCSHLEPNLWSPHQVFKRMENFWNKICAEKLNTFYCSTFI